MKEVTKERGRDDEMAIVLKGRREMAQRVSGSTFWPYWRG